MLKPDQPLTEQSIMDIYGYPQQLNSEVPFIDQQAGYRGFGDFDPDAYSSHQADMYKRFSQHGGHQLQENDPSTLQDASKMEAMLQNPTLAGLADQASQSMAGRAKKSKQQQDAEDLRAREMYNNYRKPPKSGMGPVYNTYPVGY